MFGYLDTTNSSMCPHAAKMITISFRKYNYKELKTQSSIFESKELLYYIVAVALTLQKTDKRHEPNNVVSIKFYNKLWTAKDCQMNF